MQVAFWSNMHGQAAVTSAAASVACTMALKTSFKTLVAHNHIEKSALEGYLLKKRKHEAIKGFDLSNQGIDALVRLIRNGRLKPEMVPDYTCSLMKDHKLDLLFGSLKRENVSIESQDILFNVFECARAYYDVILVDVHSGMSETNSRLFLETSDTVIVCLNQNKVLLDDLMKNRSHLPFEKSKRLAYIVSRYDKESAFTIGNISREYGIDRSHLFELPYDIGFMDACNQGRVFEYISYHLGGMKNKQNDFLKALLALSDFILEGCGVS